ncbi:RNB domain-containing ribonuclease [Corynebacterium sp. CNCTC7651]|uniref:RNB domain-containing ribonuclease n=1 Tax=Corynebacterium sp. CNCTC7651 TaxID=2815361 RepID=UPI001F2AACD2|nr:RNB domain-containing ribonuclease [Corynebacterium sp. CNCTC7651]UIZ91638.1 RNB domain-containing ribonuclease [Corynebacterium sp. CNCTC7651]
MKLYAAPLNFRALAEEFAVPTDFAPEVVEEAARLSDQYAEARRDARAIPLVTIDPPGSKDLDQAVYIERRGDGYRVLYAIADVAAFVEPATLVKQESLIRGQTVYLPDEPARLHPAPLSEGSASLLPGVDRPAVLWRFDLDAAGEVEDAHVERALVHSVARLDYDGVQDAFRRSQEHPSIHLLPEVGRLRQQSSLRRAAINLRVPSVRVVEDGGVYELVIEPRHPVMDYNSEISLLTGMVAGRMMEEAGQGILRTLGPATAEAEAEFRREAVNLGYDIPGDCGIGEFLAGVDADTPRGMAVMREAQKLLRGAGYVDLSEKAPEVHAGIGGYYSHVTAPLRRLVDRYATEYCLAICGGYEVPAWVTESTATVLQTMARTSQLANTVDRAALHLTEATVLAPWVGQNFSGVVLKRGEEAEDRARIFVTNPPVLGPSIGAPPEGTEAMFSLVRADPAAREVVFAWPAD